VNRVVKGRQGRAEDQRRLEGPFGQGEREPQAERGDHLIRGVRREDQRVYATWQSFAVQQSGGAQRVGAGADEQHRDIQGRQLRGEVLLDGTEVRFGTVQPEVVQPVTLCPGDVFGVVIEGQGGRGDFS